MNPHFNNQFKNQKYASVFKKTEESYLSQPTEFTHV